MGFLKHKLGLLVLLLCLGIVVAAIWYLLFGLTIKDPVSDGTLVKAADMIQGMMAV